MGDRVQFLRVLSPKRSTLQVAHTPLRWALTLSVLYACQLGSGFAYSYLPRYLSALGWSTVLIGAVLSVSALARSGVMPVWSWFSDLAEVTGRHLGVRLVKIQFVLALPFLALPFVENPWVIAGLLIWVSITVGSSLPILDVVTMRELGAQSFGRIRAWGSLGFGLAAVSFSVAGNWLSHVELAMWSPVIIVVFTFLAGVTALAMPRSTIPVEAESTPKPSPVVALKGILGNPWVLLMMPLWALHWASQMPYNIFLVFLAEAQGFGAWVPGAAVVAGVTAEIAFLALGQRLIDRLGPTLSFAIIILFTALRWFATAWIADPWALIVLQTLHGLTFGGFMLSMMAVLNREIPKQIRTSAQALLYVMVFGLGTSLGQGLSGYIVDHHGSVKLFEAAGWLEFLILVPTIGIVIVYRRRGRHLTSAM